MKPHGGQRRFQPLTTASDAVTTLDRTYRSDLEIAGNGIMQVYDLGDATTYVPGRSYYIFWNNSPEFVGVKNSDNSVWHRVPPRATCYCILESGLVAAGVWFSYVVDPAVANPIYGLSRYVDSPLHSGSGYFNDFGTTGVVSGAGAIITSLTTAMTIGGRQGISRLYAGTTAAGYAEFYTPQQTSNVHFGSGCRAFTASVGFTVASAVADEYIGRLGEGDNITGGAHTEGSYFFTDRLNIGDDHWQFRDVKTAGGAGVTTIDTGISPLYSATFDNFQRLRGEVSSNGARADAFINATQVTPGGGVANLPATSTTIKQLTGSITGSAYASVVRQMYMDYYWLQSYPTTLR